MSTSTKTSPIVKTLCIPHTFGPNGKKKGVNKQQVFWHMRNMKIGHIDHIDMREITDKNGVHIRQWFVKFSSWNADPALDSHLQDGNFLKITYDDFGHFWKVFNYRAPTPKAPTGNAPFTLGFAPNTTPIQLAPIPLTTSDQQKIDTFLENETIQAEQELFIAENAMAEHGDFIQEA
jgi:hypothetical protein